MVVQLNAWLWITAPRNAVIHAFGCTRKIHRSFRAPAVMIGMLPAVLIGKSVAAVAVLIGVCVASAACDAHSTPTVPTGTPVTASSTSSGTSASRSATSPRPSPSPLAGLSSPGVSPSDGVPSALASEYPSEMTQIPAAIQTVRNFFDGVNHEIDTGDEAAAIATFTPKCQLCGEEVYSLKQLLDGGHTLRGGHLHLLKVDSAAPSYHQAITVTVMSDQDAAQQLDAKGNVVQTFPSAPASKLIFDLELDVSPPKIWMLTRAES